MLKRSIGVAAIAAAFVATGSVATGSFAAEVDEFGSSATQASKSSSDSVSSDAKAHVTGRPIQCDGVMELGDAPKAKLVVSDGASCTVVNSTIKSLRALPGSVDVRVIDTEVTRNLMVRGATGTVHIGPKDCRYDPMVGNNVIVRNSHNVLICFTSVDNNIMVRNNDGRITLRDSSAGNNIMVNRNLAYAPNAGDPATLKASKIRLLRLEAGNHIVARDNNATREVVARDNTPVATIA
ncbi:MAG TPA: hypothetical protein VEX15_10380 [Nocardioidaceae bacterium]|nr:hypothetical protein [Nocardioidaceae bacterium]